MILKFSDYIKEQQLNEGVHDPAIFKAVFLAGGPGSGKSHIVKNVTRGHGFKLIDSDAIFEKMLADVGMKTTPEDIFSTRGQELRSKAKDISNRQTKMFTTGRMGLVIDGTGQYLDKIEWQVNSVKKLGYDCCMVFVNTTLDIAQARNAKRSRNLSTEVVEKIWHNVQNNITGLKTLFGDDFIMIENNDDNSDEVMYDAWKQIMKFAERPVKNPIAKQWIEAELKARSSE